MRGGRGRTAPRSLSVNASDATTQIMLEMSEVCCKLETTRTYREERIIIILLSSARPTLSVRFSHGPAAPRLVSYSAGERATRKKNEGAELKGTTGKKKKVPPPRPPGDLAVRNIRMGLSSSGPVLLASHQSPFARQRRQHILHLLCE